MLGQEYPTEQVRILVVDDDSSDRTAEMVRFLSRQDPRLKLLSARPLAAGWKGKPHACWIGANAVPDDVVWLCFLDADMRGHPLLLASAVCAAVDVGADLLSLAPRHELGSFAERLMIPCGHYLLAFTQDLQKIQSPGSGDAVATGQFMLIARGAYRAVGGHSAVRSQICEDVALARLLKRRGYRVLLQDGSAILATRMYSGWSTLWPGIAKNLPEMLGGPMRTLCTAFLAVAAAWASLLLFAVDLLAWWNGSQLAYLALIPALCAVVATFALHCAGAAHFRIPLWYGLLFPLGYAVGAIMAADSLRRRAVGRIAWKRRIYQE
jgi:chlorobactene glucosyltransferase